jgi:hypothetical protein
LGQFGGTSKYIQQKLAKTSLVHRVKFHYSRDGKLNVVRGAISERLSLRDNFVRRFEASKSYGTLVTFEWCAGSDAQRFFPNGEQDGILESCPYDPNFKGLMVIEWAIPKVSTILIFGRVSTNLLSRQRPWKMELRKILARMVDEGMTGHWKRQTSISKM